MCVLPAEALKNGWLYWLDTVQEGSGRKLGVNCWHATGRSIRVFRGTARERVSIYRDTEFMEKHSGTLRWDGKADWSLSWLAPPSGFSTELSRKKRGRTNFSSHWTEWLASIPSKPNPYPNIYLNCFHPFAMLTDSPSMSTMCPIGKYMKTHKPMGEIIYLLAFLLEWLVLYRDTGNIHGCGTFRKHNLLSWNLSLSVRYAWG